ncbi:MAG: hypothetical protein ABIL58_06935 [Pseudomonadota bacterium]
MKTVARASSIRNDCPAAGADILAAATGVRGHNRPPAMTVSPAPR